MSIKIALFDLDGTLLPMDQDAFISTYFKLLAEKLEPHGYDPMSLIDALWHGTKAMMKNDGSKTNERAFWDDFSLRCGKSTEDDIPLFDEFYRSSFDEIKKVCGYNPLATKTVRKIKDMGLRVALATNPLFPSIATEKRIRWTGLEPEDFEFYTTFENFNYSKPNHEYYEAVIGQAGVEPEECLMIGNDVDEDMVAQELGIKVFLLTDCLINKSDKDISVYPNGGFDQLLDFISGT